MGRELVALAIYEPRTDTLAVLPVPPPEGIELYGVTTADPAAAAREIRRYLAAGAPRNYIALEWPPAQSTTMAEAG